MLCSGNIRYLLLYNRVFTLKEVSWGRQGQRRLKLENGHYGNVLVKMNGSSEWQGVCDDSWYYYGTQNAEVICRMLGFQGAINFTMHSEYGVPLNIGYGEFGLDDIQCQGYEMSLEECSYYTGHNCGISEYAGVACGT